MSKSTWIAACLFALGFGCSADVSTFRSAVTGEMCEPNIDTLIDRDMAGEGKKADKEAHGKPYCFSNNGHGNNEDGVDSSNPGRGSGGPNGEEDASCNGSGDCIDDEIKGSKAGECVVPPGCDDSGCCDEEVIGEDGDVEVDDGDDVGDECLHEHEDGSICDVCEHDDGSDTGGDDSGGDDSSGGDDTGGDSGLPLID